MTEEQKQVFIAWLAFRSGGLSKVQFGNEVQELVGHIEKPSDWLLEVMWGDALEKIDEGAFTSEPQAVLNCLKLAFKKYSLTSTQLRYILESYFLCQEYGGFESTDEKLDLIYERYQVPKLELEEHELLGEIEHYFKCA
jgi:hypothetical protein